MTDCVNRNRGSGLAVLLILRKSSHLTRDFGVTRHAVTDFILGTHPVTTKGTTQVEGGAQRRSEFDV